MLLLIDNYDSFTYNLYQLIESLGIKTKVIQHDKIEITEIEKLSPKKIVISPGPKTPNESGISNQVIKHFHNKLPILGVCLGHECIGQIFGEKIIRAKNILHGKTSKLDHKGKKSTLFNNIPQNIEVARYHSLILEKVPKEFTLTAWTKNENEIMSIEHNKHPLFGIQFHPESFMTEYGDKIMLNFLNL